jgi:hypothetical protein
VSDQPDLGAAGFERVLAETRRVLGEAGAAAGAAEAEDAVAPELTGTGTGAGGQITATVRAGGKVESVQLDPRALRLGAQALGEQVTVAVNAALDDLRTKAGGAGPVVVPPALAEQMQQLQDQSVQQMQLFSQGIAAAVERITRATGPGRPA